MDSAEAVEALLVGLDLVGGAFLALADDERMLPVLAHLLHVGAVLLVLGCNQLASMARQSEIRIKKHTQRGQTRRKSRDLERPCGPRSRHLQGSICGSQRRQMWKSCHRRLPGVPRLQSVHAGICSQ